MLKEYCDRCKKEIDRCVSDSKKQVRIIIPGPSYSVYDEYANLTLCKECFDSIGIRETVKKCSDGEYQEKSKEAVEKLLDIIRELVTECMEEV